MADHLNNKKNVILFGASSDIGYAISLDWLKRGWNVFGTYRAKSANVVDLQKKGAKLIPCDFIDSSSVDIACKSIISLADQWDALVVAPATLEPIGIFSDCNFSEWEKSFKLNFLTPLAITHSLIPFCNRKNNNNMPPTVLYFAGGGTNGAPPRYSAYTCSKIALIKMVEVLDAELDEIKFVIIGPGWVDTKIHNETLRAGARAGASYEQLIRRRSTGGFVSMDDVVEFFNWTLTASKKCVSGRNFSVSYDKNLKDKICPVLENDKDLYKLRRYGNDLKLT